MADHHEIERSYALLPEQDLPDLSLLPGVVMVGEPERVHLAADYYDTADLSLVRAGVSLRRRTGGEDAGWHLKVPAGQGRDEVHRPLGSGRSVPAGLARIVLGLTRGRDVVPVATIQTTRTTVLLYARGGSTLAEVADDSVVGRATDGSPAMEWREVEVELVDATPALFADVDALMAEVGIAPAAVQRKIGSVLAHRLAVRPEPRLGKGRPAGRVLHHRLTEQVTALMGYDRDVRRGVDDGVHQLRVACRRLRGALATYRPLVDRAVTDPIRDELRWLAQTLGDGRDAEVMRDRLRAQVDDEPRALVVGPVRRRLDVTYAERLRGAGTAADEVMGSARYLALLGDLDRLVADPPFTEQAAAPARDVLLPRVERDWKRLRERVRLSGDLRRLGETVDDEARDEALHDVRKAAKRLRYACEAVEPVWGGDAKALRRAAQEVTRVLGDRQDGAVARVDLRRIAALATEAGESAFTYGVLHAREEARSVLLDDEWHVVWRQARDRSLRAWLG